MTENVDPKVKDLEQAHFDFISTVSHELRTPLTSIRGFADTLLSSFDRLSPEQRMKFLNIIKDQSNRLINLVENLLTVSKLQSNQEVLVYKTVNVNQYIESCVQLLKNQYKTHKFELNLASDLPPILIDTDKFQQIMINLTDNAAKYSDDYSEIKISTNQETSKNAVMITIQDRGIGISKENIEKVFTKFSRVDSPLTRKIQGSGLGLFITRNLVERMNGKIEVESSTNGSKFTVIFPVSEFGENSIKKIKEK